MSGCSENLSYFSLLSQDFRSTCVAEPLPLCCKNTHLSTYPQSPQGQSLLSIKCVSLYIEGPEYCLAHSRLSVNICCWILLFPILFSHLFRESKNAVVLVCGICHCWPSALLSIFLHWVFYFPVFDGHAANWPTPVLIRASLVAQMVKNLPVMQETWVQSLGWEDLLKEGMATHSSVFAWRIPWTEEPGGLQSMGSQRLGHDWVTKHSTVLIKESSGVKRLEQQGCQDAYICRSPRWSSQLPFLVIWWKGSGRVSPMEGLTSQI